MTSDETNQPEKQSRQGQPTSHLRLVKLRDMVPAPKAQRQFSASWAGVMAANLDLEKLGHPVVSKRGAIYYIIDGQHRVAALKLFGFLPDDQVMCECYADLTEQQEAEVFLGRNTRKAVDSISGFRVAVHAERADERTIDEVVRHLGLHIGRRGKGNDTESIGAVSTLRAVFRRIGPDGLAKTLRIIRDAYGTAGLEASVIDGVGLCVQRYDGNLHEDTAITALSGAAGGLNGLLNQADKYRARMGERRPQCIAATAVDLYNRAGGKKGRLLPWWKE